MSAQAGERTDVEVRDNPQKQRFELTVGGRPAGRLEYKLSGRTLVLVHTVVDEAFKGQGLGPVIVRWALDHARAAGLGVIARCPFAAGWLRRHPEYQDLLVRPLPEPRA